MKTEYKIAAAAAAVSLLAVIGICIITQSTVALSAWFGIVAIGSAVVAVAAAMDGTP